MNHQQLVDAIFRELNVPVTLTDARNRLLAFSVQPAELIDDARRDTILTREPSGSSDTVSSFAQAQVEIARFMPVEGSGLLERVIVPLRTASRVVGFVYIIDPEHRVDAEVLARYANEFSAAALKIEIDLLSRPQMQDSVRILLTGDDADRQRAVQYISGEFGNKFDRGIRVVALESDDSMTTIPQWVSSLGFSYPWGRLDGALIFIVPHEEDIATMLQRRRGRMPSPATRPAVGRYVERLIEASESARTAMLTLCLAADPSLLPRMNPVYWDHVGPWKLLLSIKEEKEQLLDPRVIRLTEAEDRDSLRMLQLHLERGKAGNDIASEFHLHRTTLYSRLRKLQADYGLDWEDPDDRLATILGLRFSQLRTVGASMR